MIHTVASEVLVELVTLKDVFYRANIRNLLVQVFLYSVESLRLIRCAQRQRKRNKNTIGNLRRHTRMIFNGFFFLLAFALPIGVANRKLSNIFRISLPTVKTSR